MKHGNNVFIPILQWLEGKVQSFDEGSAKRGTSVLKQKNIKMKETGRAKGYLKNRVRANFQTKDRAMDTNTGALFEKNEQKYFLGNLSRQVSGPSTISWAISRKFIKSQD